MKQPSRLLILALLVVLAVASASMEAFRGNHPLPRRLHRHQQAPAVLGDDEQHQVHISLGDNPGEMVVMWVRHNVCDTSVQYRIAGSSGSYQSTNATCYQYTAPSYTSGHIHRATMTGLKPSTRYEYVIGPDSNKPLPPFEFVSAPQGQQPVHIGVIGDLGQTENSKNTIQGVIGLNVDMCVLAGDLSYSDGTQELWVSWANMVEPLASSVPVMTAVGNHEVYDNFAAYKNRFYMPSASSGGGNFYYAFDYSYVHFVILSTESDYTASSDQYKWVSSHLPTINRQKTPWVVMMWHRPYYTSSPKHQPEVADMKTIYEDLFFQNKVDFVINGHVHAYERLTRVYKDQADPHGIEYFVVGDAGNHDSLTKKWDVIDTSVFHESSYGYAEFFVHNATHIEWNWRRNADGEVGDTTWVERPFPR